MATNKKWCPCKECLGTVMRAQRSIRRHVALYGKAPPERWQELIIARDKAREEEKARKKQMRSAQKSARKKQKRAALRSLLTAPTVPPTSARNVLATAPPSQPSPSLLRLQSVVKTVQPFLSGPTSQTAITEHLRLRAEEEEDGDTIPLNYKAMVDAFLPTVGCKPLLTHKAWVEDCGNGTQKVAGFVLDEEGVGFRWKPFDKPAGAKQINFAHKPIGQILHESWSLGQHGASAYIHDSQTWKDGDVNTPHMPMKQVWHGTAMKQAKQFFDDDFIYLAGGMCEKCTLPIAPKIISHLVPAPLPTPAHPGHSVTRVLEHFQCPKCKHTGACKAIICRGCAYNRPFLYYDDGFTNSDHRGCSSEAAYLIDAGFSSEDICKGGHPTLCICIDAKVKSHLFLELIVRDLLHCWLCGTTVTVPGVGKRVVRPILLGLMGDMPALCAMASVICKGEWCALCDHEAEIMIGSTPYHPATRATNRRFETPRKIGFFKEAAKAIQEGLAQTNMTTAKKIRKALGVKFDPVKSPLVLLGKFYPFETTERIAIDTMHAVEKNLVGRHVSRLIGPHVRTDARRCTVNASVRTLPRTNGGHVLPLGFNKSATGYSASEATALMSNGVAGWLGRQDISVAMQKETNILSSIVELIHNKELRQAGISYGVLALLLRLLQKYNTIVEDTAGLHLPRNRQGSMCTFNSHWITHLIQSTLTLGPWYCTWCWYCERHHRQSTQTATNNKQNEREITFAKKDNMLKAVLLFNKKFSGSVDTKPVDLENAVANGLSVPDWKDVPIMMNHLFRCDLLDPVAIKKAMQNGIAVGAETKIQISSVVSTDSLRDAILSFVQVRIQ